MSKKDYKKIDQKIIKISNINNVNRNNFKKNTIVLSAIGVSSIIISSALVSLPLSVSKINNNSSLISSDNKNDNSDSNFDKDSLPSNSNNESSSNSDDASSSDTNSSSNNNSSSDGTSLDDGESFSSTISPENRNGTMAASVSTQLAKVDLNFKNTSSNSYNLTQNYIDFADNNDFSSYSTSSTNFKTDLYLFVNNLWTSNNKNFDIKSVEVKNFFSSNNNITLNKTKVSFDLLVEIYAFKNTQLTVSGKSIYLTYGNTYTLNISSVNQITYGTINVNSSNYYLGWKLNNVAIKIDNKTLFNGEFIPTVNNYSSAFQYTFTGLTTQNNYLQLYKKYQQVTLNMNSSTIKIQIKNKYDEEFSNKLDIINYGIQMLEIIKDNPTINNLLKNISSPLSSMLVSLNILPSFLTPIISEAITSSDSILSIFVNNKSKILSYIKQELPEYYELAKPLIESINNNMTETQIKSFDSLLAYVGIDNSIIEIINKDFFGLNGTPLSLTNFIYSNVSSIMNIIASSNPNNSTYSAISTLVNLFLGSASNAQKNVFDIILKDSTSKENFFTALGEMVNLTSVANLMNILITKNSSLNSSNIQSVLTSIYNFVSTIFAREKDYQNFWTGYKYLEFTSDFTSSPIINKTNQTINFSYQINFHINKTVKLDLKPFKNLLDADTIWTLINSFQDLSQYSSLINRSWLYSAAISFIPDYILVGGSELSDTKVTYSASNSSLYFSPTRSNDNYYLGYKFKYNTRISYKDQSLITSITSQYAKSFNWRQLGPVILWGDFYYSDFWRSIISNVITRDYVFTSVAEIQYSNTRVANETTYNPDLYISGFEVKPLVNKVDISKIYNELSKDDQSTLYDMTNYGSMFNVKWSDSISYYEIISGFTPKLTQKYQDEIFENSFNIKENKESLSGTNLSYSYTTDVLFNFTLPMKIVVKYIIGSIKVNINVNLLMFNFKLFLPFKYYDIAQKKLVDNYSTIFTYFNATTAQSQSWFFQSSFYE